MSDSGSDKSADFYLEPLTRREQEILLLLVEHLSNNEIAQKLTLAPSSIKWYTKQIFAKLGINSRQQVADRARELGLIKSAQSPSTPQLHNLPVSMTPFIGRRAQVEQVKRMVSELNYRLVTLTGAGGVGKTRLALRVAESVVGTFKHGVWLVELASLNNGALVDQTVAMVFGLNPDPEHSSQVLLSEYLRDKTLLLILDDCEHLIDDCARLVDTLLRLSPGLHVLVTSRESLGLEGEIPFSVPSMTFPNPFRLPPVEQLTQYEAVHLFADRAQSVSPGFAVTGENGKDIARICKRLDGIPLAIELAAARIKILSVEQIANYLEESFSLLAGGFRIDLPRHQTMRASINWSYQLLSEDEQTLLRRFSVFSGGWTLEACAAVCSDRPLLPGSVIDLLTQLVNKSLVIVEQGANQTIRYYLLGAIWEFADEKTKEAGEQESVRSRHLAYFLKLAETSEPNLRAREQIRWLDRLRDDLANLRSALEWGLKTDPGKALALASALKWFWHIRGRWSEGLDWITRGLEAETSSGDRPEHQNPNSLVKAKSLGAAGFLYRANLDYRKAEALLNDSLALFREKNPLERSGMAFSLLELASCATARGEYARAEDDARESQALYAEAGDRFGVSECLSVLGANESDPLRARQYFLDALAIKREIEDINGLAYTLQMLGEITVYETDFEKANAWLEESLEDYCRVGNKKAVANDLHSLSWMAWIKGDYARAVQEIDEAIQVSQEIDERGLSATNLLMRSDIHLSRGDYEGCMGDIAAAGRLGQETGDQSTLAFVLTHQGRLSRVLQQLGPAAHSLDEALKMGRERSSKYTTAFSQYYLGQVAGDRNDLARAAACHNQSLQTFYEMNFWYWDYLAYPLEGLARCTCLQGRFERAAVLFGASERFFRLLANTLSPIERSWREKDLETTQKSLGDAEFEVQRQKGYALTPEQAMAYASGESE
jgi:predicted ATPase/DNA-binding CsgD family transcriptional regulator